jgi:hypothetical protein
VSDDCAGSLSVILSASEGSAFAERKPPHQEKTDSSPAAQNDRTKMLKRFIQPELI